MSLPDDLLDQAEHLVERGRRRPKQADLRRGISSAYYALFHLLIADGTKSIRPAAVRHHVRRVFEHGSMKAVCKGWALGNVANIAEATRSLVTTPIEPELQAVAEAFVNLQEARHSADYDLSRNYDRVEARSHVAESRLAFKNWHIARRKPNASVFLAALLFEKQWKTRT